MSDLDDLRDALLTRAEGLDDQARTQRPAAVHQRVRVVRRRRRAVAGSVAAVMLVAGGLGGLLAVRSGRPDAGPATSVLGEHVPARVTVLGAEYRLVATHELSGFDGYRLQGDGPRGVVLAYVADTHGTSTLDVDDHAVARVLGTGASAPTLLDPGRHLLSADYSGQRGRRRSAVAVYHRVGRPAGVTSGEVTYRTQVDDSHLLTAGFLSAATGRDELTLDYTAAESQVALADYCRSAVPNLWISIRADGHGVFDASCDHDPSDDPGATADRPVHPTPAAPVELFPITHTVRISASLLRGGKLHPVPVPHDAVLGVGVYRVDDPGTPVLGSKAPTVQEYAGRTWVLDHVTTKDRSDRSALRTDLSTADGDRLLVVSAGRGSIRVSYRSDLGESGGSGYDFAGGGTGGGPVGILFAGDTYHVSVTADAGESPTGAFRAALLVYRPAG